MLPCFPPCAVRLGRVTGRCREVDAGRVCYAKRNYDAAALRIVRDRVLQQIAHCAAEQTSVCLEDDVLGARVDVDVQRIKGRVCRIHEFRCRRAHQSGGGKRVGAYRLQIVFKLGRQVEVLYEIAHFHALGANDGCFGP